MRFNVIHAEVKENIQRLQTEALNRQEMLQRVVHFGDESKLVSKVEEENNVFAQQVGTRMETRIEV
jgi:hypothetical protein